MNHSSYAKPQQDKIIYEFKYTFPKKAWFIFERFLRRIVLLIVFFASYAIITFYYNSFAQTRGDIYDIIIFLLHILIPSILMLIAFNSFFIMPRAKIALTDEGMYIKASYFLIGLWNRWRFYKYGDFGCRVDILSARFYDDWIVGIYNIDKYKISEVKLYALASNGEMQDMDKLLDILQQKSQQALESQGKAAAYDIEEKIRYRYKKGSENYWID